VIVRVEGYKKKLPAGAGSATYCLLYLNKRHDSSERQIPDFRRRLTVSGLSIRKHLCFGQNVFVCVRGIFYKWLYLPIAQIVENNEKVKSFALRIIVPASPSPHQRWVMIYSDAAHPLERERRLVRLQILIIQ